MSMFHHSRAFPRRNFQGLFPARKQGKKTKIRRRQITKPARHTERYTNRGFSNSQPQRTAGQPRKTVVDWKDCFMFGISYMHVFRPSIRVNEGVPSPWICSLTAASSLPTDTSASKTRRTVLSNVNENSEGGRVSADVHRETKGYDPAARNGKKETSECGVTHERAGHVHQSTSTIGETTFPQSSLRKQAKPLPTFMFMVIHDVTVCAKAMTISP